MRNIKFRAWDKEKKCMIYSDEIYPKSIYKFEFDFLNKFNLTLIKIADIKKAFCENGEETFIQTFKSVDADIMQYIGMCDMNNREIYEGDIVKYNQYPNSDSDDYYEVLYMFGVELVPMSLNEDYSHSSYEIIGNIYENPELLKKVYKNM